MEGISISEYWMLGVVCVMACYFIAYLILKSMGKKRGLGSNKK